MAGKRRAAADGDDDTQSQQTTPPSKRTRTADSDSEPEVVPVPSPNHKRTRGSKGKGKARQVNEDESEPEEEVYDEANITVEKPEDDDEEEEQKFEEEHGDAIRAAIEAKRRVHGGIAEYGIIESITMVQFMCHKYLNFQFGPQINFIIGHNGSGKSAVLSAITVALGGKATSTGRGTGIKSFIREGQSAAQVIIKIKNQGEEAYKPAEYGKTIIIERRFTKEGNSTWKIKSHDDKLISSKKEELSAICDHMNIQVDNPMNVLTQDAARQFLSAASGSDKYKFFLKGTQLSQLTDEYDTCLENIDQTTKVLQQKKEAIPDLKAAYKEASTRFQEASKAREQKKKADELKKELAWAHVKTKEDEMKKKLEEAAKLQRRLPKIQESFDKAEAAFKSATEEVTRYEAEHQDLGDIEHLNAKKKELNDKMRVNKGKISEFNVEEKKMDTSLKATKVMIAGYETQIATETRKLEVHTQEKREETNRKLEEAKESVSSAEAHLRDVCDRKRQKQAAMDAARAEKESAEQAIKTARNTIDQCNQTIQNFRQQEGDALAKYGKNMKSVMADISRMKWHGDVIGPFGLHVKVKEPQKWADLMRSILGGAMTSFAITEARDMAQLKDLFKRTNNGNISIVITGRDMFDYSTGEPPANMLTVLRALEINDPFVLRILINQTNIEKTFLARTRRDADNLLRSVRGGGQCWTADWFRVNVFGDGGGKSDILNPLKPGDTRRLMFPAQDAAGEIQQYQNELKAAEAEYKAAIQKRDHQATLYQECRRACEDLSSQEKKAHQRLRQAKTHQSTLQEEANNDLPAGIAGLEAAKLEAEQEMKFILEQFEDLVKRKAEVDDAQRPLLTQLNVIKKQIDDFEDKRVDIRTKVEDAVQKRLVAQNERNHYAKKLDEEQRKIDTAEAVAKDLEHEFEAWTEKAAEFCERYENPRAADVVQRNLDSVQAALKEREKRHGATVEEMTIEVNKTKATYETAITDLKNMGALNKALKSSLIIRLAKWQEFRRHIALRCKLVFQYHLSNRGYYGKVLFDHKAGTLQLKVQTDDQTATQGRDKDPRSLSGGEKSFSTICLLLSLWESIGCPLRCLDEFDVFMDAVNRRISMKMMIDTANASDKKQYILITPQDMNNVAIGSTVRVHRMTDPERGQGVLAF